MCRELGVSEATYQRRRNYFGGLNAEDAKRLKDLEREKTDLKRLLADAELEKDALRGIWAVLGKSSGTRVRILFRRSCAIAAGRHGRGIFKEHYGTT